LACAAQETEGRICERSRLIKHLIGFRRDRREAVFLYERKDQDKRHAPPITISPTLSARADDVIE